MQLPNFMNTVGEEWQGGWRGTKKYSWEGEREGEGESSIRAWCSSCPSNNPVDFLSRREGGGCCRAPTAHWMLLLLLGALRRGRPAPKRVFSSFHSWRCLMPGSFFITINATDMQLISHPVPTNTQTHTHTLWNQSRLAHGKIKVTIFPPGWAVQGLQSHCHVLQQLPTERKNGGGRLLQSSTLVHPCVPTTALAQGTVV